MNTQKGNIGSRTPSPAFAEEGWGEGLRLPILIAVLALAACAPKGEALYARAEQALEKGDVRAAVIDLK